LVTLSARPQLEFSLIGGVVMRAKKSVLKNLRQVSLTEFAESRRVPSVMVTTKEAYTWAALMAHIADKHPEIRPEDLVGAATSGTTIRRNIKYFYKEFPLVGYERGQPMLNRQVTPDPLEAVIGALHMDITPSDLIDSARNAYASLTKKGLIEDPIEILVGGVLLAAMGILPVSFTRKTKEGRSVSKKLKALYWTYEKSENRGITTTKVEFRLLRMIKAFKAGMVGGFNNALKDDGDEGS
jgi:hypothetical protein